MTNALYYISMVILGYFSLLWVGYLVFLCVTFFAVIRKFNETDINPMIDSLNANPLLPITVIIPAYNEAKRIKNTVTAILNSDYKNVHIIIVNDGSKDNMMEMLIKTYELIKIPPAFKIVEVTGKVDAYYVSTQIPNFIVIDKEHSPYENSAADSINAGINVCRTPLHLTIDADTILEKEALTRILFTFLVTPHCVAVGGAIYVPDTAQIQNGRMVKTNIPANVVLGVQVCEYLRSFIYGREGWGFLGGALCHPGAFTLFETKAVIDAGGCDPANFSYDAEITMKLHHYMRQHQFPYNIAFSPSAIAWSEEPSTLKSLWNQRNRWQRGLLRCLSHHKGMLLNPFYGITGLVAFPFFVLYEVFGPVVEAVSYIIFILALFFIPGASANLAWLLLLAWGYMLFITMSCMILSILTYDKYYSKWDILHIFGLSLADMVFYRQWRAFCALFSSFQYVVNRLQGKPE